MGGIFGNVSDFGFDESVHVLVEEDDRILEKSWVECVIPRRLLFRKSKNYATYVQAILFDIIFFNDRKIDNLFFSL